MIVAERKPIEQIISFIAPYKRILLLGCGECVTVCFAGGEKEVGILAGQLRLISKKEGKEIKIQEKTVKRQCDREFLEELEEADAVLSLACGAGVQFIAEIFPAKPVYPCVDTKFIGVTQEAGLWKENCQACGACVLAETGGICPIARCSKSLLNGPCGGSQDGKCEVDENIDCAWQMICDRMKLLGREEQLKEITPIKDWSTSRDNGPRKVVRKDLNLE